MWPDGTVWTDLGDAAVVIGLLGLPVLIARIVMAYLRRSKCKN